MRIFISYARKDDYHDYTDAEKSFVRKLYNYLSEDGHSVWWDREAMPSRALTFLQEIRDAISSADVLLYVVGTYATQSDYVRAEWEYANSICLPIIPILREDDYTLIDESIRNYHAIDARPSRNEADFFTEISRILSEPQSKLGQLHMAPSLPPHYVPRESDIRGLQDIVLADINRPTVITSVSDRTTSLYGMGGIGKSVIATALAHRCETRRAFPDGIFWLTIGQNPSDLDLNQHLRSFGHVFGDEKLEQYADYNLAKARVMDLLSKRSCLIILDDIWETKPAEVFKDLIGPTCRLLLTTRDLRVTTLIGANEHRVNVFSEDEAVDLLKRWTNRDEAGFYEIARKLKGLPLALKLAGALLRESQLSSSEWLSIYDRVSRISMTDEDTDIERNLMANIQLSVNTALPEQENHLLYHTFGIFEEDVQIPQSVIMQLWGQLRPDLDQFERLKIIERLARLALIEVEVSDEGKVITLHDLLHSFNQEQLKRHATYKPAQEALLQSYLSKYPEGWHQVPHDNYIHRFLLKHMREAEQFDHIIRTIKDSRWLVTKANYYNALALVDDFKIAQSLDFQDKQLDILADVIKYILPLLNRCTTADEMRLVLYTRLQNSEVLHSVVSLLQPYLPAIRLEARQPLPDLLPAATIRQLQGLSPTINGACLTDDGSWVAGAYADGLIRVWDMQQGDGEARLLYTISAHEREALCCDVSQDNKWLLTGSEDGTVQIWDIGTQTHLLTLEGHQGWIRGVQFNPEANRVYSASHDGTIRIWEIKSEKHNDLSGKLLHTLTGHTGAIRGSTRNADGTLIASASSDATVRVWDTQENKLLHTFRGHNDGPRAVAFSSDNTWVVSAAADATLRMWSLEDDALIHILVGHQRDVISVGISHDNTQIVSGSSDGYLNIWNTQGELIHAVQAHDEATTGCGFLPDDRAVWSCSHDGTFKVWTVDAQVNRIDEIPRIALDDPTAKTVNPALVDFVSDSSTGSSNGHSNDLRSVDVSADGRIAATSSRDSTVKVWDVTSGKLLNTLSGHQLCVASCAISPDQQMIASGSFDHDVVLWNQSDGSQQHRLTGHTGVVFDCVFTPNSQRLLTASFDNTMRVWDCKTGELIGVFEGYDEWIMGCAANPDGTLAASVGWHGRLATWDIATQQMVNSTKAHDEWIHRCYFSADGTMLVTCSGDRKIRLWNVDDLTLIREFEGHTLGVNDCSISPDGRYLMSAARDNTLRLWNMQTGENLITYPVESMVYEVTFHPSIDGQYRITAASLRGIYWLQLTETDA